LLASYPTLADFRTQAAAMKGAGMTKVPDPVLRERFGLVTEAARDNPGRLRLIPPRLVVP
jgi:hypothetical protein